MDIGTYIETVSVDEVIWCLLKGHHGPEVEKQTNNILSKNKNLLEIPNFNDWEENMIRRGALSYCAGSGCPLTSLILRTIPYSKWNKPLKFGRSYLFKEDFLNLYEINNKEKLKNAINNKKYKNNKKVEQIKKSIRNNEFDFKNFNRIVLYNSNEKWFIIDGTHRAIALTQLILNEDYGFPSLKVVFFKEKLKTKIKWFSFKQKYLSF